LRIGPPRLQATGGLNLPLRAFPGSRSRGLEIGASIVFIEAAVYAISLDPHRVSGAPIVIGVVGGATLGWLVHRPGPWTNVYP